MEKNNNFKKNKPVYLQKTFEIEKELAYRFKAKAVELRETEKQLINYVLCCFLKEEDL